MEGLFNVRPMEKDDYESVKALWMTIHGFGIRSIDDSKEGVDRFIDRNPGLSQVAVKNGEIVGSLLCGHDGRRGTFYHVCVKESERRGGIGTAMATAAMQALQKENINKVSLLAFKTNQIGNGFWHKAGWIEREDINYYDFTLNEENITRFNA